MKTFILLMMSIFFAISFSEPNPKLVPFERKCNIVIPIENYSQTVLFDMDVFGEPELKTCILKECLTDHTVILLNVFGRDIDIGLNVTRTFIRTNDNPNVLIMTKYLTRKVKDSPVWKFFSKSKWSVLYVIVTGKEKYKCTNGTMETKDFQILEKAMNNLWHKLQIMRVAVLFPNACKQKIILYHGKRPSSDILYDRSIKVFNNSNNHDTHLAIKESGDGLINDYPMQGGIFHRIPTSIKFCDNMHYYVHFNLNLTLGYCGLDGMVMHDILTYLKFNLTVPENPSCGNYGYALPGNVSGVLGCIIRNEVDISFNSRFMTMYSDEHIYYLHYVTIDTLCALTKRPDVIPLWQGVYNFFSTEMWTLTGVVLVVIACILWATALVNKTITGSETETFWSYLYSSVISTMIGYSPMKTKTYLMIRSACLMGSILFLAVYQSHMSRVYTTMKHFPQLKTLQDLYCSGASLYTSPTMREFMRQLQNPDNELQSEFFNKASLTTGERLGKLLENPHLATIDRKSDAEMEILKNYSDSYGMPLIDILEECFKTYYVSYIARSDFPFFETVQRFMQHLQEAGLPAMYYKWTQQMLDIPSSVPDYRSQTRPFSKIQLIDQSVAFAILGLGIMSSIALFIVEMWNGKRKTIRRNMNESTTLNRFH
ncbi:uncharacterized protein LOC118266223 [Spodoptera frugiperda]|uniref:Uncharacterized protein LOC118266223 n=1 Tax=Spodoptera frugiperda TaxID=7108 RepID=A0A9R0CZV7_SPOFR|nr:uncharacterized protein LOC118266223 [Spodoptera frugiperda]